MFFAEFTKIAAFDLLEFEYFNFGEFMDSMLDLIPTGPLNSKFEAIGFESLYFINNLGSFFLVLVFGVLLLPIWLLLESIGLYSQWAKRKANSLSKRLFINTYISTIVESFMIVILCALITVKYATNLDAEKADVHTVTASLAICVYFLLPLVAFLVVLIYF